MPFYLLFDECLPILELLTLRTRVATREQLLRFAKLYPAEMPRVASILSSLEQSGYLISHRLTVPLLRFKYPVYAWEPGSVAPDFHEIANLLTARSYAAPWRAVRLYWAARKAESLTGGLSGVNRQPLQVQHDLGTTAAYLHLLAHDPLEADRWLGEDILLRDFPSRLPRKRPDAAVIEDDGEPTRLIEIGGVYSPEDLRRIHRHYSRQGVCYEIW